MLALLLFHKTEAAGDTETGGELSRGKGGDEDFKSKVVDLNSNSTTVGNFSNFYEIEDSTGMIVARLVLTQGPFFVELVKTKNESGVLSYVTSEKSRQIHQFGNYSFTSERPKVTATKSGAGKNGTELEITFSFTENTSSSEAFNVKTAELKMTVEWGVPVRMDYWNMTNITLSMSADINITDVTSQTWTNLDLSPRFSYNTPSEHSISPACTNGYGICAPIGLCWSCNDQVLKPHNIKEVGADKWAVFWHLPGLVLEPEWGPTVNLTMEQFRFSANWDCDPLIPLSVWVGLLVSLLLVSILAWAIKMLTDLQVPNKWDDPKKPGIHVPQAE